MASRSPSACGGTAILGDVAIYAGTSRDPNATFAPADADLVAYYGMGDGDGIPRCAGLRCADATFSSSPYPRPSATHAARA